MGQACEKLCSKTKKQPLIPLDAKFDPQMEKEVELDFVTYKSSLDGFYKKAEDNYNFLKYFQLYEYMIIFSHVKGEGEQIVGGMIQENNNVHNYDQELTKMEFLMFIENKIIKNYLVITIANDNEESPSIFKDFMSEVYDALIFATIDIFKRKNPGVKVKKGSIKSIKKLFLYVIPLLHCSSSNKGKVDFLYTLFADRGLFPKNGLLSDFLFYLFIYPSTCAFRAVKQLGDKYPNKFDQMSNEEYAKKSDALEVDDIIRLIDIFMNEFFKDRDYLNRGEFEDNFRIGEFGWIFSASGIRSKLEQHNDVKINVEQ